MCPCLCVCVCVKKKMSDADTVQVEVEGTGASVSQEPCLLWEDIKYSVEVGRPQKEDVACGPRAHPRMHVAGERRRHVVLFVDFLGTPHVWHHARPSLSGCPAHT